MPDRVSVAELGDMQVQELQDAFWALKRERVAADGLSTYDRYVVLHYNSMEQPSPWPQDPLLFELGVPRTRNAAHRGPAFLPWHREYLRRFEFDLQRVSGNPNLGLPYWDWAADAADPDASRLWDVVGPPAISAEELVIAGRFRFDPTNQTSPESWVIVDKAGLPNGGLIRSCGHRRNQAQRLPLPTQPEINFAKSFVDYDVAPWNELSGMIPGPVGFRNLIEGWVVESAAGQPLLVELGNGLHNRVHEWIGGSMQPGTSPNDPIFFLHHAFVDKIWADWEQQHPSSRFQPQVDGPAGHGWNDAMYPWNGITTPDTVTVAQGSDLGSVRYI